MNKSINRLLFVLGIYSLAIGIYYNFLELWMAGNNLSIKTISIVLSLCSVLSVSIIFLCSNLVKKSKLKKFIMGLMISKFLIMLVLYFLNGTGLNVLIKFLVMLDYMVNVETVLSFYPLISLIKKDDKLYARKDLIYALFYYIGVLFTNLLLGKNIGSIVVNYNSYLLISAFLVFISLLFIKDVKVETKNDEVDTSYDLDTLKIVVKKVLKDEISKVYLLFLVFGQISYRILFGMGLTVLMKGFSLDAVDASNITLATGIGSAVLGFIVLSFLTFKNDYLNLSIKYLVRVILFFIGTFTTNKVLLMIAILYPLIISQSYSHITDAPYINRFDADFQLTFCNLREMVRYFGEAIGIFICGFAIVKGLECNFMLAGIFGFLQLIFSFYALYLRKKEVRK